MTSSNILKVGIVGLEFGAEFIPIYQSHPNAEMYAICQRTPSKLNDVSSVPLAFHRASAKTVWPSDGDADPTATILPPDSIARSWMPEYSPKLAKVLPLDPNVVSSDPSVLYRAIANADELKLDA